jgi:hypothetical protein
MMLRRVAGYVRSNALGAAALFVALGGASLAVTRSSYVARDGTVHACVSRSGAVRFAKVGRSCGRRSSLVVLNQKGTRGAQGLQGAPGAQGAAGGQGMQGLQGIPGPTQASASDQGTTDSPPATGAAQAAGADVGTIVMNTSGRLLITASGSNFIQCSASGQCSDMYGLYVDGQPVPHTLHTVSAGAGAGTPDTPFFLEGLTGVLPAGSHTYTLEVKHSQFVVDGDAAFTHLWALLVGGG